jgi:hypothetical protein
MCRMKESSVMHIRSAIVAAALLAAMPLAASGPLGIYGIIERVVFEPDEAHAARVQVWGAFSYVDGGSGNPLATSNAERGYLYFQLPADAPEARMTQIRREWADLKSVAGTGQAVGFGSWGYIGAFRALDPATRSSQPPYILGGRNQSDVRVRPASEQPVGPAVYQTDSGVVKINATGDRAAVVTALQNALRK